MKLLLLLAFVASAYSAYFEPGASKLQRRNQNTDSPNVALLFCDPHVLSFDGLETLDYRGVCTNIVLRDNCKDGYPDGIPTFTVYADYYRRGSDEGSSVRQIYIEIVGQLITVKMNGEIYVGSQQITSFPHEITSEVILKNYRELDVKDGLNVEFVYWPGFGGMDTYMEMPDSFQGKVCGLVGNFNGDMSDDRIVGPFCPCVLNYKPGVITSDLKLFGDSWQTDKFPDSDSACDLESCGGTLPPHPCTDASARSAAEQVCNALRITTGIFRRCLAVISRTTSEGFFEACVYDVCAMNTPSIADRHIRVFDDYCQRTQGTTSGLRPDANDKTCSLVQGGSLNTFDGLNLRITKDQKTLLARYNPAPNHNCRFQVRAVTTFDCAWDPPHQMLPELVDWVGATFDTAKRSSFGRRNILLTQLTDQVRIRGEGIDETVTAFPHLVALSDNSAVLVDRDTVGGQVEFRVRSSAACQWGVNWRPDTRNSEVDVFFGGNYGGQMEGMCGDADGNMANDWKTCSGGSVTPGPAGNDQISDSCLEGKHQGQGIDGCTKTK